MTDGCERSHVPVEFLECAGKSIAYKRRKVDSSHASVLFLNGLKQDMEGRFGRGVLVDAREHNLDAVVFDYHGVGRSSRFPSHRESFASWLEDALNVLDQVCGSERQILLGFFTGAWVALHVALQRPNRIKAIVLVSPGVDITDYWWQSLRPEDQEKCRSLRKIPIPTAYHNEGESGLPLSFLEGAEEFLLLKQPSINICVPIRIYQGLKDSVVPPVISRELLSKLSSDDVHLTLIKDAEHFLLRTEHIYPIFQGIDDMANY